MKTNKSSISKAKSYREIGEFWDTHDLAEYWDQTELAEFEVDLQSEITYYALDSQLSEGFRLLQKREAYQQTLYLTY
jgi:hypothetical protein